MSIKQWPKMERPREKLIYKGADHLSDAELLAIFINTGIKGKTALDIARDLLNEYGDLFALVHLDRAKFCNVSGLGEAKYVQLQASLELAKRCLLTQASDKAVMDSTQAAQDYLRLKMGAYTKEVFAVLLLNNRHEVLHFEELFKGSVNETMVYINPLVKTCMEHHANTVILAHNHPSGQTQPSAADIKLTKTVAEALRVFEISLLDHFIITAHHSQSLAELGYL